MAQEIRKKSRFFYAQEFSKGVQKFADTYYYDKHFRIGEGIDMDRLQHTLMFSDMMCTEDCQLIDYIDHRIGATLKDCPEIKRGCTTSLIKQYKKENNNHPDSETMLWSKLDW